MTILNREARKAIYHACFELVGPDGDITRLPPTPEQVMDLLETADYWQERAEAVIEYCVWTETSPGVWESQCGKETTPEDGSPNSTGYEYCPYCGKALLQGYAFGERIDSLKESKP